MYEKYDLYDCLQKRPKETEGSSERAKGNV